MLLLLYCVQLTKRPQKEASKGLCSASSERISPRLDIAQSLGTCMCELYWRIVVLTLSFTFTIVHLLLYQSIVSTVFTWTRVAHVTFAVFSTLAMHVIFLCCQWCIYHWATWAMAPPLNCEKKSHVWQKMQPKCAIFRQKSQKGDGLPPPFLKS